MTREPPTLCVIVPAYNEADGLPALVERVQAQFAGVDVRGSILLVDDGSSDGTWAAIEALAARPGVSGLRLSRNFGKEAAMAAGLDHADADAVVLMDADLQHPPEVLPRLVAAWQAGGCDVVHAVKARRPGESAFRRACSRTLFAVTRVVGGLDLDNSADFKLLDRRVVAAWRNLPERTVFFRGVVDWLGFRTARVEFDVAPRAAGTSKWGTLGLARYALNAVNSFSAKPLKIVSLLCVLFLVVSSFAGVKVIFDWVTGRTEEGFPTVILLSVLFGNTVMISLALMSWYVAKIFEEVKLRPRYVVAARTARQEAP